MKSYAIMHQELHVATIRGDGSCIVYSPQFMPYNLYLEKAEGNDLDTRINCCIIPAPFRLALSHPTRSSKSAQSLSCLSTANCVIDF